MKYINNFTSNKHVTNIPIFDILVWHCALHNALCFGYTTKLYCTKKDIPWLEKWNLLQYYQEVDTDFLEDESNYPAVDQTKFWSIRKLICINHEFEISTEPFVFADVDVVLYQPLKLDGADLAVWSPDPYGPTAPIYCEWKYLSAPQGYRLPAFIRDVDHAWNCGIMYFNEPQKFRSYYRYFLDWTVGNPCQFLAPVEADCDATLRNVWACNAEQRILAAVADKWKWKVATVMPEVGLGISENGIHFYIYRAIWRRMRDPKLLEQMPPEVIKWYRDEYKSILKQLWNGIEEASRPFFVDEQWLMNTVNNDADPLPY